MLAQLWATNRRTPASRAAARSASVPSVRSWLVCAKLRSRSLEKVTFASAVAWWTIASGLLEDRLPHRAGVEQIEHDRLAPERLDPFCVSR